MKKSRILAIVLSFIIALTGFCTPAYAQEKIEDLDVYMDTSQYDELNDELEAYGRMIREGRNENSRGVYLLLPVTRLVQSDSRWANVQLGTSSTTIGAAGCCLTSFTMIRNCISGTSDTPINVNSRLGAFANPFDYSVAANTYRYSIATAKYENAGIADDTAESIIIGAMEQYNVPVLVGVKNASGGTHFVVACGYTTNYEITIKDPASRNYTNLTQYFNAGYYVHRIYCFVD